MTNAEDPGQRQLDAYNTCDLERLVVEYADEVMRPIQRA